MVAEQLAGRGLSAGPVLRAMEQIPRHRFVGRECQSLAYDDRPLPIGLGQTISQPYMVALMTGLLNLHPADRVLEIGTGSGYQTAVLAALCAEVTTIERHGDLLDRARRTLGELGYANIHFAVGDGTLGYPERAPYDAIIATAGGPRVPRAFFEQLAPGGRIVCPVGTRERQRLTKITRQGDQFHADNYTDCLFVPLTGEDGWPEVDP